MNIKTQIPFPTSTKSRKSCFRNDHSGCFRQKLSKHWVAKWLKISRNVWLSAFLHSKLILWRGPSPGVDFINKIKLGDVLFNTEIQYFTRLNWSTAIVLHQKHIGYFFMLTLIEINNINWKLRHYLYTVKKLLS